MKLSISSVGMTVAVFSLIPWPVCAFGNFQPKGHIVNDSGRECGYTQVTEQKSTYFHRGLTARMGVITFDDPTCMAESGVGLGPNKMMINNVISRWYSHSDANFKTRASDLYPSSPLQKRGQCMQSEKYAGIGVVVDYEVVAGAIARVRHSSSLQGCSRK